MSHHHHQHHQHHHSHRGERKVVPTTKIDLDMEMEDEEEERSRCAACLSHCRQVTTFLLSHVGLISLVVGYCIMGAFTFEALESSHEIEVKQNMTKVREAVTASLWTMTREEDLIKEDKWVAGASKRLQEFESELLKAMKKRGWDGSENELATQWTFSGALFYSIVVITTIGYGHISPKTVWGKVVTIFYAILGIPLMLLCLSHIGDFMANAFRFLYWKVCCFMCTRRPKPMRRHPGTFRRGRSLRSSSTTKHSGSSRGMKRSNIRRSARISQRSADSAFSDPSTFSIADTPVRRVHSDEDLRTIAVPLASTVPRLSPPHLRPYSHPRYNTFHAHHQRSSRSAEPPSAHNPRNLPVLFNKYAEDVITDESEIRRDISFATRSGRIKPPPERFQFVEDYWDEDVDEYVYGVEEEPKKNVPILLCLLLVLSYILFGAFLFSGWENWNFLDSAYFCFITLTTIGFGDFVPAQRKEDISAQVSIALCSLYLLFGISLLAMSFNLVQEEVISSVKQVGARLGIIREEET